MKDSLFERLREYCGGDSVPMHMPGHKRNTESFPYLAALGGALDITEIDSFDDLNAPSGVFAESERLAAELWGSEKCIFSVNGSTGALLAAVRAALHCRTGRTVLVARSCHRAVYHALELCACRAKYILPPMTSFGAAASLRPCDVSSALAETPDAAAVIITSPTYEGVISDISGIAEVCHAAGVPLVVDEAHGAHLMPGSAFGTGAAALGADIAVQSLHKTLPSLTQTAAVHLSGSLVSARELCRQMTVFQTSSPSYLLSASIDAAVRFLAGADGARCMNDWHRAAVQTHGRLVALGAALDVSRESGVFAADCSKLVLRGGFDLMRRLRRVGVELEMATPDYAVAMTGAGDSVSSLRRLETALEAVLSETERDASRGEPQGAPTMHLPECVTDAADAVARTSEKIPLRRAVGRVSAGYVTAYPPGIPLVVPGERFDGETLRETERLSRAGASLRGIFDDGTVLCLAEGEKL